MTFLDDGTVLLSAGRGPVSSVHRGDGTIRLLLAPAGAVSARRAEKPSVETPVSVAAALELELAGAA